jgi:N-formylglutamate deformylase
MTPIYRFTPGTTPVLISVPHAGTFIPDALRARMTPAALDLPDTDWHVDTLYGFAAQLGVGLLTATHSRYVIDLNRDSQGKPLYPGADNTELCPLTTFHRDPVYRAGEEPVQAEIAQRVVTYWQPYHDKLTSELAALRQRFGVAVLWDGHSIASEVPRFFEGRLPDFNLGTARGASADPALTAEALRVLESAKDYSTVLNGRFTGGFITRRHGQPAQGIHALQLEMAQIAYMDEKPPYPLVPDRARRLQDVLEDCVKALVAWAKAHAATKVGA